MTHCPALFKICFASSFSDIEKTKIEIPSLLVLVSEEFRIDSIPASQPQAITEVAKPVNEFAASLAHFLYVLL